jgi:hypothetical protein
MSVGYEGNPYVLNIVPLFGIQQSASGSSAIADIQGMVNTETKTINANTIGSFDSGSVQFTSPIVTTTNGGTLETTIAALTARIAALEARVTALGG